MSTSIMPPAAVGQDEPLSEDLETTACQAAIELDNLVIGSSQNAGSIQKLAERLTTELPEAKDLSSIKHLVAPSTVIVMSGAIRELHEPLKQSACGIFVSCSQNWRQQRTEAPSNRNHSILIVNRDKSHGASGNSPKARALGVG